MCKQFQLIPKLNFFFASFTLSSISVHQCGIIKFDLLLLNVLSWLKTTCFICSFCAKMFYFYNISFTGYYSDHLSHIVTQSALGSGSMDSMHSILWHSMPDVIVMMKCRRVKFTSNMLENEHICQD